MKNTRFAALALVLLLLLSAVGCGGGGDVADASGTPDASGTQSASGGASDGNYFTDEEVAPYRGTTVKYATWIEERSTESGPVISGFENETGIKVELVTVPQGTYATKMAALITAGQAPDVYCDCQMWPSMAAIADSVDKAGIDVTDPMWDQTVIKYGTINGRSYLVNTVNSMWADKDMIFYNKKIFRDHGWTTPEEYYKAGKWNYDTMTACMKQVANLGTEYIGGAVHLEGLIHAAGGSVIGMKNGQFVNGTQSAVTQDVMRWASTGLKEGWLSTTSIYTALNQFPSGKVGIATLHSFGLKKTGYLRNMKASDIGFTYLPSYNGKAYTPTSFVRGWGLCKGAKNPVAAGIFLRYYLDVNNYDTKSAFISTEAQNFFFKLTSTATANKNFYFCYGSGVNGITGKESAVGDYVQKPAAADPSQVATVISSYQNELNADIAKLNAKIK